MIQVLPLNVTVPEKRCTVCDTPVLSFFLYLFSILLNLFLNINIYIGGIDIKTQDYLWDTKLRKLVPGDLNALKRQRRKSAAGRFIYRVPLDWIARACPLGGKALALALAIRYQAKFSGDGAVKLPRSVRAQFDLANRMSFYRAASALEQVGLVRVQRQRGQSLGFQIVESDEAHHTRSNLPAPPAHPTAGPTP